MRILKSFPLCCSLLFVSAAPALMGCDSGADTTSDPNRDLIPPVVTIAEARAMAVDKDTTVEGFVTVVPGTFNSATGEQGFALQDATGGIYVSLPDKLDFALDAKVRVTGKLGQTAQQTILSAEKANVSVLNGTQTTAAKALKTGEVGESVEGLLLKVSGKVSQAPVDDLPYGIKLYMNDGSGEVQVFVHLVNGAGVIDTSMLAVDQMIEVTGLGAQYETTYEVAPRMAGDLVKP